MSALQLRIQPGMPRMEGLCPSSAAAGPLAHAAPGTALVRQPEATSESGVRRAGRRRRSGLGEPSSPGEPGAEDAGCSGDRDRAEVRNGEGAGESEPGAGALQSPREGASRTLYLPMLLGSPADAPRKPSS